MGTNIFEYFKMDENLGSILNYRDYKIKSWCHDIPVIKNCISKLNFEEKINILEIGVHGGGSFLMTFDIIENKNCNLIGIDCWEDIVECGINGLPNDFWEKNSLNRFLELHKENRVNLESILKKYDTKNQVKIIKGFSTDPSIINEFGDETLDIIYIDGDHSFNGCYSDLCNWYPKLKNGGFIINDDYLWDDVNKSVNLFCEENKISVFSVFGNQSMMQKIIN